MKVADNIVELVEMCSKQQISGNPFLREVRAAPEFSVVLANNRQLDDIMRFCARSSSSIFGIDPTFNICDHNIIVTTFKHPRLVNSSGVSPVLLGPVLLHGEKTFESYFTLLSTLVRLKPEISNLRTFGTDGEINLYQVMNACFKQPNHLLCWIHVKDNISQKLSKLKITNPFVIIHAIFGEKSETTKIKGLLNAENEDEFEEKWKMLADIWKEKGKPGEEFLEYMVKYQKDTMRTSMIASVREKCGLGKPRAEYAKNSSESINSMLKKSKGVGKLTVKNTVQLIASEVEIQEPKIKMALIGRGHWSLAPQYKQFDVSEEVYY